MVFSYSCEIGVFLIKDQHIYAENFQKKKKLSFILVQFK